MYNAQTAADSIKKILIDLKITGKQMAIDCDLGVNVLSNIRRGDVKSIETFDKIADYLGCSLDYLIGKTDNPEATLPSPGIQQDSAISRMPAAGSYGMTSAEKELIRAYRRADSISQAMVLRALSIESPAAEKESGA